METFNREFIHVLSRMKYNACPFFLSIRVILISQNAIIRMLTIDQSRIGKQINQIFQNLKVKQYQHRIYYLFLGI